MTKEHDDQIYLAAVVKGRMAIVRALLIAIVTSL